MGKINILGFDVANLIAAGEVVDRPSSVVKELLENALDAGSTIVTVEIKHGGVTFIRVTDNGCGMDTDDLPTAILRHATSKIQTADDLSDITTLGFRGEALAAIASVSRLRIFSKTRDNNFGALLESEGGEIVSITETGCADGTTVIAEDLFFNVPARRKFLKKDSTEAISVGAVIEKIALSRPNVSIKYICDGEIKFMTAGNGNLSETVWALFGREVAKRMLKTDREEGGIHVTGYVSEPDMQRSNRNMQNFFINGRFVKSKTASAALEQAYTSKIPSDKFPACVMNIELNPAAVDVNVHPAKLEVKFANEKLIFDAVYYAVLSALEADVSRPDLRLANAEKPAQTQILSQTQPNTKPKLSAAEMKNAFVPLDKRQESVRSRQIEINSQHNDLSVETMYTHREAIKKAENAVNIEAKPPAEPSIALAETATEPINAAEPTEAPEYIILGEAYNCYVIVQLEDRLLMIDKHAAHERIIFDELCRKSKNAERTGQMLITPCDVTLSNAEADSISEYSEKIKAMGFDYTLVQQSAAVQKASIIQIPSELSIDEASVLFTTLASRLSDITASVESAAAEFFESRLWQASCKAAIKGGRIYNTAHIKWICDRLITKPNGTNSVIRTCPHGRPVAFEIKKSSIERQFERTM